jgi:hypothetical protein
MGAAEKTIANLHSMPDYSALAVLTNRCNRLDRTFEAVEGVPRAGCYQLKTLVILIATDFARCHTKHPPRIVEH